MAANKNIQYCIPFFFHSWRCPIRALWVWKKKHFPGSKEEENPGQSIILCLLMMDSCLRATISERGSSHEKEWINCHRLGVWGKAKLWLEFSIRTSRNHHAIERGAGGEKFVEAYSFISPVLPSCISKDLGATEYSVSYWPKEWPFKRSVKWGSYILG